MVVDGENVIADSSLIIQYFSQKVIFLLQLTQLGKRC